MTGACGRSRQSRGAGHSPPQRWVRRPSFPAPSMTGGSSGTRGRGLQASRSAALGAFPRPPKPPRPFPPSHSPRPQTPPPPPCPPLSASCTRRSRCRLNQPLCHCARPKRPLPRPPACLPFLRLPTQRAAYTNQLLAIARELPAGRQTLFFSATWPRDVQQAARRMTSQEPVTVFIGDVQVVMMRRRARPAGATRTHTHTHTQTNKHGHMHACACEYTYAHVHAHARTLSNGGSSP